MAQSISREVINNTGLPGAQQASRYVGATTSGYPTAGTFFVGDFVVDQTGGTWICTVSGVPGSWTRSGVSVNNGTATNLTINGTANITVTGYIGSQVPNYSFNNDSGSATWWNLGTWYAPQGGNTLKLQMEHHGGYNAQSSQSQETHIFFKTSNGGSLDPNGFAADGMWWSYSGGSYQFGSIVPASGIVVIANNAGVAATSYTFYAYLIAYQLNSNYTVTLSSGTSWVANNIPNSTPSLFTGSASSAVLSISGTGLTIGNIYGSTMINPALVGAIENCFVYASYAPNGVVTSNVTNGGNSFTFYPTAATGNFSFNVTGSPTINNTLAVGQSITNVVLTVQGSTAYYCNVSGISVDGTTTGVTTYWQGHSPPSTGHANSIDAYSMTIIKTASTPTYTVLAAQTQF